MKKLKIMSLKLIICCKLRSRDKMGIERPNGREREYGMKVKLKSWFKL